MSHEEQRTEELDGQLVSTIDGWYEAVTKDADGNATVHRLYKHSVKSRPAEATTDDLAALIVREASSSPIRPLRASKPRKTREALTIAAGDAQYPFADEHSVGLFHRAVRELQPDTVVLVGDMVDFPALSKYEQRKEWVGSTQASIDGYHGFLAKTRANAPNSRIVAVHGNHEQRLISSLERNLSEVAGLRRALGNRALLSVQNLCRYDELEVESVDGYPNGVFWLEDNLKFIHGTNTKKGGSNAAKYLQEERETTIYGHTHRQELAYRTYAQKVGAVTLGAGSPGALCRLDGLVPGYHYSPQADGAPVQKAEDWQAGIMIIHHEGAHHDITPVRFSEKGMLLNGTRYAA